MLIDTDVLIWNLRGNEKAAELLDHAGGFIGDPGAVYLFRDFGLRIPRVGAGRMQASMAWMAMIGPCVSPLRVMPLPISRPHAALSLQREHKIRNSL